MLTSSMSDTRRSTIKWHEETYIVQTYIKTRLRHVRGSRSRHEYDLRHVFSERRCPLNTLIFFVVHSWTVQLWSISSSTSRVFLLVFSFSIVFILWIWELSLYWRIDDRSCVNLVSIICSTSTWLFCLSFSTDRFRSYDNSLWQKRRVIRASTRVMNRSMDGHMFLTILLLYLICFSPERNHIVIFFLLCQIFSSLKISYIYIYI